MKNRIIYFLITSFVMILGLASRKYMSVFPDRIAPFVGDALWAMMVYFGFRFLFPKFNLLRSFILAMIFSFTIEFSQLYQAEWLNDIRSTTFGALVLGHGFLVEDLISYAIGIIIGTLLDTLINQLKVTK